MAVEFEAIHVVEFFASKYPPAREMGLHPRKLGGDSEAPKVHAGPGVKMTSDV